MMQRNKKPSGHQHKRNLRRYLERVIGEAALCYADESHRSLRISEVVVCDMLKEIARDMEGRERSPLLNWRVFGKWNAKI